MSDRLNYPEASKWLESILGCHVAPDIFTGFEGNTGIDMTNIGDGPIIIPGEPRFRGYSHRLREKGHCVSFRLRLPIPNQNPKIPLSEIDGAKMQYYLEEFNMELRTQRDVVEKSLGILRDMFANPKNYDCEFYGVGSRDKLWRVAAWGGRLIYYNII